MSKKQNSVLEGLTIKYGSQDFAVTNGQVKKVDSGKPVKRRSCDNCIHCVGFEDYEYDEKNAVDTWPIRYHCLKLFSDEGKGVNCSDAYALDSSHHKATFRIVNPKLFCCSLWEAKE